MNYFNDLIENADGGVFVIAEACDNHMGSLEMAKALAREAKKAGADAVKFQHHLPDEEMRRSAVMSDNFDTHLFDFLEENALSLHQHRSLKRFCDELEILYLCTPFSFKAAMEIRDLVPFFKIGSGEFADFWFTDQLANLGLPILVSTGMSNHHEVIATVEHLMKIHKDLALMNCLSEYPPVLADLNLGYINVLRENFPNLVVGHSDHTPDITSSIVAVAFGATIIEKHITLNHSIFGPDRDVSINFQQLCELVVAVKSIRQTLGSSKVIHQKEESVRDWAYRSLVATRDLHAGHVIADADICSKRPFDGIPSSDYTKILGRKLTSDIMLNSPINWGDID